MIGERLLNTMRNVAKLPLSEMTDLLVGTVSSIDPLKVKFEGKFEIDEDFLLLSPFVQEFKILIPELPENEHYHHTPSAATGSGGEDGHSHSIPIMQTSVAYALPEIKLWRGLKVGDIVRVLRINQGQLFYILDREGDLADDTK